MARLNTVELIRILRSGDPERIMEQREEIADLLEELDERIAIMAEGCSQTGIS